MIFEFIKQARTFDMHVGARGPAGPQGEPGTPGTGVTWRGAWSAGAYVEFDGVQHLGSSWIAKVDTSGIPGVSADWELWVSKGDTGATGATGPKGDTGNTGATGATGPKGDTGDTGPQGIQGPQGPQGIQGIQGVKGDDGDQGPQGEIGPTGADGRSAYQVATDNGYVGTEYDWLQTLIGPQGLQGNDGPQGPQGEAGPTGPAGADGAPGVGVPAGGTTGQILAKNSGTDYDTGWINAPSGSGGILASIYAHKNAVDQSITYTANVAQQITFPTEVEDTAGRFASSILTVNSGEIWELSGAVSMQSNNSGQLQWISLFKNGVLDRRLHAQGPWAGGSVFATLNFHTWIEEAGNYTIQSFYSSSGVIPCSGAIANTYLRAKRIQ